MLKKCVKYIMFGGITYIILKMVPSKKVSEKEIIFITLIVIAATISLDCLTKNKEKFTDNLDLDADINLESFSESSLEDLKDRLGKLSSKTDAPSSLSSLAERLRKLKKTNETEKTEPNVTVVTEPNVTEPAERRAAVSQPAVSQPAVSQPAVSQPDVSQPALRRTRTSEEIPSSPRMSVTSSNEFIEPQVIKQPKVDKKPKILTTPEVMESKNVDTEINCEFEVLKMRKDMENTIRELKKEIKEQVATPTNTNIAKKYLSSLKTELSKMRILDNDDMKNLDAKLQTGTITTEEAINKLEKLKTIGVPKKSDYDMKYNTLKEPKNYTLSKSISNDWDLNDEYTLLSTDLWQIPSKEPRHQCIISKDLKSDVHPSLTSGYPLLLKDFDTSLKVSNTMINKDWASDQKSN